MISAELLKREAQNSGFRPDSQEKVILLIELLNEIAADEILGSRLALKGGTALNLFVLNLPRLSVDIDLNYIGAADLKTMQKERPDIEHLLEAICTRQGFKIKRQPGEHAGGKYVLGYTSALGSTQNLQIDVNYMYRVPLFKVVKRDSHLVGSFQATKVKLLHHFELVGGKVAALLGRTASRDLFDTDELANLIDLTNPKVRLSCILYGAMSPTDWRQISLSNIDVDAQELKEKLVPVLRTSRAISPREFGESLVKSCMSHLKTLFPLRNHEHKFISLLRDQGKIEPTLLTEDSEMQSKISQHPALQWRAQQAGQRHKKNLQNK